MFANYEEIKAYNDFLEKYQKSLIVRLQLEFDNEQLTKENKALKETINNLKEDCDNYKSQLPEG